MTDLQREMAISAILLAGSSVCCVCSVCADKEREREKVEVDSVENPEPFTIFSYVMRIVHRESHLVPFIKKYNFQHQTRVHFEHSRYSFEPKAVSAYYSTWIIIFVTHSPAQRFSFSLFSSGQSSHFA